MPITVRQGDTLSQLAQKHGLPLQEIIRANPQIKDPTLIRPGENINLPGEKTLTPLPEKTLESTDKELPETPQSGLMRFSSALNEAVELARSKRRKFERELLGKEIDPGVFKASDFASILENLDQRSRQFTDPLTESALDVFEQSQQGNTFEQRTIEGGGILELELSPAGQVVNQRVIRDPSGVGGAGAGGAGGAGGSLDQSSLNLEQRVDFNAIFATIPTRMRDSNDDRAIMTDAIIRMMNSGMDRFQIMDVLAGFKVDDPTPLSENLRFAMARSEFPKEQYSEIARLINNGRYEDAIVKVENNALAAVDNKLADSKATNAVVEQGSRALRLLENVDTGDLGAFDGRKFEIKKGFFSSSGDIQAAQRFSAAVAAMVQEFRRNNIGTAATENETRFLEPLVASLKDQPELAEVKIEEFVNNLMMLHNASRRTVGLPEVTAEQVSDVSRRLPLYGSTSQGSGVDFGGLPENDGSSDPLGLF